MPRSPVIHGFASWLLGLSLPIGFLVVFLIAGGSFSVQAQVLPQQGSAAQTVPNQEDLTPGIPAVRSTEGLPAIVATPIAGTPLSGPPYVFALERRNPAQMQPDDAAVVSSFGPELSGKAALAGFDLAESGWHYRQIVCPALPDYLILDFSHGPDPNGSSRFVATLSRSGPQVRIVSSFAHGMLPFEAAWSKPATYEIFNHMLRQERGLRPMSNAPNWLVIGMCFAELSGHHVQVLTHKQLPQDSLDMLRLHANQPQLHINPDHSAEIVFSDASKPGVTTDWDLHFDRHGQITSVSHTGERQPTKIALRP